ncbi:unnamed protein product [Triticum turgidum subsp. durum]|uniref:Uncharacterized protein n=1 Tax=Triticum turgidum subsp. durum TaxID=4567 RepID=A0A9R0WTL1_TRITD|nr:unnamed protein product [Triticum turgidum subsp. durum]
MTVLPTSLPHSRVSLHVAAWMSGEVVPRRLDGVQAQPRRPLITGSATTSLGDLQLPPAPQFLFGEFFN